MNEEDATMYACRVDKPDGPQDLFTLLPPDAMFEEGLAPQAVVGACLRPLKEGEPITPENFARNRAFVGFMQQVIARHAPDLPELQAEARRQQSGWVYVIDLRTLTPAGAVPPHDIFGGFAVKNGAVIPGSYRPNPNHRILSEQGFFRLDKSLHEKLLEELRKRNAKS